MLNVVRFSEAFSAQEDTFSVDGKASFSVSERDLVMILDRQIDHTRQDLKHEDVVFFQTRSGKLGVRILKDRERDETDDAILYCHFLLNYV